MDSFIPFTRGPHAVVWADRVASASDAAEAVALLVPPPNVTVTSQVTCCDERVDQSR
jgi:hypothetical protein